MTFSAIQARFLYLIGETDTTQVTAIHKSHINTFVRDITNAFPFSWNLKTADLTLTSGTADLASDHNQNWHLADARITGSSANDDNIFMEIDVKDRDNYDADSYVYWITWDTSGEKFIFNSHTQTGTVTIYYYFEPADLSADADVCIVPDGEAVAYGAASKNWIGDERNVALKQEYSKEASSRIQRMYNSDVAFGPQLGVHSVVRDNPNLTQSSVSELKIARP